jgi:hypothetical protein
MFFGIGNQVVIAGEIAGTQLGKLASHMLLPVDNSSRQQIIAALADRKTGLATIRPGLPD